MKNITKNTLLCILILVNQTRCIVKDGTFNLMCNCPSAPNGVVLKEHVTSREIDCAMACINTVDCQFISMKPNSNGRQHCKLYRPDIVLSATTPGTGRWATYGLLGTPVCDRGWETFGRSCYKFFDIKLTWPGARGHCEAEDSTLVSITSALENEFVANLPEQLGYTDRGIWLGGHDHTTEGVYEWVTGEPFDVFLFYPGEPNGGESENAIAMPFGNVWVDAFSNTTWYVMCEKICQLA